MLAAMAAVSLLFYERLGVSALRRAWLDTDHLWAAAFIAAGALTPAT